MPKQLPTVLEEIVAHRLGDLPGIRQRVAHVDFGALPRSERSLYDNLKRDGTSFIIDKVQVYAARYFGADAILLMLSILDDASYAHLAGIAESLEMDVLTEVITRRRPCGPPVLAPGSSA